MPGRWQGALKGGGGGYSPLQCIPAPPPPPWREQGRTPHSEGARTSDASMSESAAEEFLEAAPGLVGCWSLKKRWNAEATRNGGACGGRDAASGRGPFGIWYLISG